MLVPRTQPDCTTPPPGLEDQARVGSHHYIHTKAAPVRPHSHEDYACSYFARHADPIDLYACLTAAGQCHSHTTRSSAIHKRSASTALAGTHSAIGADPRVGCGPFPKPACCRTARTTWTRPPPQCRQRSHASSMSSLCSAMECRSSSQDPHTS